MMCVCLTCSHAVLLVIQVKGMLMDPQKVARRGQPNAPLIRAMKQELEQEVMALPGGWADIDSINVVDYNFQI